MSYPTTTVFTNPVVQPAPRLRTHRTLARPIRALFGLLLVALCLGTFPTFPALAQEGGAAEENGKTASEETSPSKTATSVVNINTADATQLALLPRVGPALAQRILDFRQENGEFQAPEDLILVRGIGEKTFRLLEPYVIVKGKTTLTQKVRGVS